MSSEISEDMLAQQNQTMAENLAKKVSRLRDVSWLYGKLCVILFHLVIRLHQWDIKMTIRSAMGPYKTRQAYSILIYSVIFFMIAYKDSTFSSLRCYSMKLHEYQRNKQTLVLLQFRRITL